MSVRSLCSLAITTIKTLFPTDLSLEAGFAQVILYACWILQALSFEGFIIQDLMPATFYDAMVCRPGTVIQDFSVLTEDCGYCRYCFRTGGVQGTNWLLGIVIKFATHQNIDFDLQKKESH